jgi:hypothetical protein
MVRTLKKLIIWILKREIKFERLKYDEQQTTNKPNTQINKSTNQQYGQIHKRLSIKVRAGTTKRFWSF